MTRLILFISALLIAAASSGEAQSPPAEVKPLSFDKKSAVSPKDIKLATALSTDPVMARGLVIDAPINMVNHFIRRPVLTSKLMAEYGLISGELEREEDGEGWTLKGKSGARYFFGPVKGGESLHFVRFTFYHSSPLGIGLKISGVGALVFKISKGKEANSTLIDYDVYMIPGERPLDEAAGALYVQIGEAIGDMASFSDGLISMVETIVEDPEFVADEMEDADETFSRKDLEEFEKLMGVKRRKRTP